MIFDFSCDLGLYIVLIPFNKITGGGKIYPSPKRIIIVEFNILYATGLKNNKAYIFIIMC